MQKAILLAILLLTGQAMIAQKPTELDKSPMDVSYYPSNYPLLKMKGQATGDPFARILYSRPQKKGRSIFGDEVKYNDVWRMGANELTEMELFKNAVVGGKKISKGRYTLYCIPTDTSWTIIFNKDNYGWGSYNYKEDKDLVRIQVPVEKNTETAEALTMFFEPNTWNILWDDIKAKIPISF